MQTMNLSTIAIINQRILSIILVHMRRSLYSSMVQKTCLNVNGTKPNSINIEKLQNEFSSYAQKKAELQKTYKSAEKDSSRIQKQINNLKEYLRIDNNKKLDEHRNTKRESIDE